QRGHRSRRDSAAVHRSGRGRLAGHRDDPQPTAGDQAVDPAHQGYQQVEDLELDAAEVPSLEELAVDIPAGDGEVVEVLHRFQLETGRAQLFGEQRLLVAAAVAQHLVEAGVEAGPLRHIEHHPAAGRPRAVHVAQGDQRVAHVLQDVQADHRVEGPQPGRETARVLEVDAVDAQVGFAEGEVLQIVEVVRVDVARQVEVARQQPGGDVADAGADLQHPRADVGGDRLGHPAVEVLRLLQAVGGVGAVLVLGGD